MPKLRFPAFVHDAGWQQVRLGEAGRFLRGLTYEATDVQEGGLLVLRSANIQSSNLVLDSDLVFVGKECPHELCLQPSDIAICMSNGSKALVGKSAEYSGEYPGRLTVGAFCSIFRATLPFAKLAFSTQQYADFVALEIGGGNINNLKNSSLEAFEFAVPQAKDEQQQVAECIKSLDTVIASQARKVEALKTYKRGMIQQLFPVSREAVPRLRFSGFKTPWQTRTLSDLLVERKQRNRSLTYGPGEVLSVSGEFGCVNQIELLGRSYAGVSVKDYHVVETGDLVYTKSPLKRNPYGIIKANKGQPGIVSTLYAVYRPTSLAVPAYLDHCFSRDFHVNSYLQPIVRKGAKNDMKVNNETVLTGEITVPNVAEQAAIADFLDSIDATISIVQRAYSVLVEHKRALMHMLFPPAEKN